MAPSIASRVRRLHQWDHSQGLVVLHGAPRQVVDEDEARGLVRRTARHFGTPWEIATNHLLNHRFINRNCWNALRYMPEALGAPPAMDLPKLGDLPKCLEGLDLPQLEASRLARKAQGRAEKAQQRLREELLAQAADAIQAFSDASHADPTMAAIELTLKLDYAFDSGSVGFVQAALLQIDPWSSDGDAVAAVLSNIQSACLQFGGPLSDSFRTLAARTVDALAQKWEWASEDVDEARQALC